MILFRFDGQENGTDIENKNNSVFFDYSSNLCTYLIYSAMVKVLIEIKF